MKGRHIGSLNVYQATTYGRMDNLIWAKSGDQGKMWNKGRIALNSDTDFQVGLKFLLAKQPNHSGSLRINSFFSCTEKFTLSLSS